MKASILDLRRRMPEVLRALENNEPVTILHRGKEKAVLSPVTYSPSKSIEISEHPAFGLWKDRDNLKDVDQVVRKLRKGRYNAF